MNSSKKFLKHGFLKVYLCAHFSGEHQAQKLVIRRLNKTVRHHEDEMEKLKKQSDKEQVSFELHLKYISQVLI